MVSMGEAGIIETKVLVELEASQSFEEEAKAFKKEAGLEEEFVSTAIEQLALFVAPQFLGAAEVKQRYEEP